MYALCSTIPTYMYTQTYGITCTYTLSLLYGILRWRLVMTHAIYPHTLTHIQCTRIHAHKHTHNRDLLQRVSKVTITDLQSVGNQYFKLLLEPTTTSTAVCCNPTKVTEVKCGLER